MTVTELAIGNMIRRVLFLVREEYTQQQDEQPVANVGTILLGSVSNGPIRSGLAAPFKHVQFRCIHTRSDPSAGGRWRRGHRSLSVLW